jgi:TetR/AcrR family transcriptional repressor of nem operon
MNKTTKTTLLDVAEELLLTRGYNGFSYNDIAEKVGIRKASIHYHFPSKSGLGEHTT